MESTLYHYKARVVSVYDGDTVRVDIDLGLNTWIRNEPIRLSRINAPEVRGASREAGLKARDFLRSLILKKQVFLQTLKDKKGKYGRYIGEIWLADAGEYLNISDQMVKNGHAIYQEY